MAGMAAEASTLGTDERAAEGGSVERARITDPVTGLPVMRYRFAGPPTLRPGVASPAGAWRVLRVEERDGQTTLDLEMAAGAEPLDGRPSALDDTVVEAALATLRRARSCGAVHGDLGPQRLWRRGARVWIEGYGVRWRDDADATSDARDLAAGLLRLPGTRLSAAARARLTAILDAGDVDAVVATRPPASAGTSVVPTTGIAAPADVAAPRLVRGPPPGSRVRRGGTGPLALAARVTQQWWTGATASSASFAGGLGRFALRRRSDGPAAIADVAGEPSVGLRPEVRLRLAIVLLVASFAWVGLATWSERAAAGGRPPAAVTGHVVDVAVAPDGHPPAGLVVVASPPGSSLPAGSVIASVPGKVWLDLDGRWRFEARFGEQRSSTVELIVPFERVLQLAFPNPAAP
jgi:hypothetical protein